MQQSFASPRKLKMNCVFHITAFFIVLATVSANEKGDAKPLDFAEELAKVRQETREMIRRDSENLHARVVRLQEQDSKRRLEVEQLRAQDGKLRQEVTALHRQLRQANSKIDRQVRQKDVNNTTALRSSNRQETGREEKLKEIIHSEIDNYLAEKKTCVLGRVSRDFRRGEPRKKTI